MQSLYEKAESSLMYRALVHLLLMVGSVGAMITCGAAVPMSVRQARPMVKQRGIIELLTQPIGEEDFPHSALQIGFLGGAFLEDDLLSDFSDDFHRYAFGSPYFYDDDSSLFSTQTHDDAFLFADDSMHWSASGDWL